MPKRLRNVGFKHIYAATRLGAALVAECQAVARDAQLAARA